MTTENTNLENFEFEESNATFFQETTPASIEEIIEEIVTDEVVTDEVTTTEKKKEEKEEQLSFFEVTEEEPTESLIPGTNDTANVSTSISTLNFLKEKGLVDYQLEEGVELTDELADEIIADNWEDNLDATIDAKIKDLPSGLKEMMKIALKGEDYSEVFGLLANQAKSGISKDIDLTVEANQIKVIEYNLSLEGHDQEYIDAQIEFLKDSGKLKAISEKVKKKIDADLDAELEAEVEIANNKKIELANKQKKYKTETTNFINATDNIKGVVLNKEDKKILPSYMTDLNVKLPDGRIITKFQKDLFDIYGNTEKLTLLAKLVNSDFDFTSISNKSLTDYTKSLKDNVQHVKGKVNLSGSKGSSQKPRKSLAELLD